MKHGAAPRPLTCFMPTNKQRISVNLSDGEYAELSALAERHNLSMAWIGHKAILDLLARNSNESLQLPLAFAKRSGRGALVSQERAADE
jgi:hypothetical protein